MQAGTARVRKLPAPVGEPNSRIWKEWTKDLRLENLLDTAALRQTRDLCPPDPGQGQSEAPLSLPQWGGGAGLHPGTSAGPTVWPVQMQTAGLHPEGSDL